MVAWFEDRKNIASLREKIIAQTSYYNLKLIDGVSLLFWSIYLVKIPIEMYLKCG